MISSLWNIFDRIRIDWYMFVPAVLLSFMGLVTMDSFSGDNYFYFRQSIWILISIVIFIAVCALFPS